jgi:hypothetical protein
MHNICDFGLARVNKGAFAWRYNVLSPNRCYGVLLVVGGVG